MTPLVIIESPYGTRVDGTRCTDAEIAENVTYARRCMRDSLDRGEAPYASHLLYTQVYEDARPGERKAGMEAGFAWGGRGQVCAVYADRGITSGMREGIAWYTVNGLWVEERRIDCKCPGQLRSMDCEVHRG